jgi:hypothetical protein
MSVIATSFTGDFEFADAGFVTDQIRAFRGAIPGSYELGAKHGSRLRSASG